MTLSPFERRLAKRDNGHHGRQAEKKIATRLAGTTQPGSGALDSAKGDVKVATATFSFLIENKATKGDSLSVKKDWCLKIYQEALETNQTPALAFQFTNDAGQSEKRERWVALPEWAFKQLIGE